ncbi:hypothetical protein DFH06DRAFT_1135507 [Mycena polygramma]|nr:hypothetical protein DFH06DRAFT_1135507 [Mycena polygramma]
MSLPPPPTALPLFAATWAFKAVHTSRPQVSSTPSSPELLKPWPGTLYPSLKPFLSARSWLSRSQAFQYASIGYSKDGLPEASTSSSPKSSISGRRKLAKQHMT